MSYVDEGPRSEEAVLLLHGNPTWSFFYRDLIRQLAPDLRCVAPDHIGMGLSQKPADYEYTLARRIADVEALVDSLRLKRIRLVVHDWGGAIGFGLAVRRPELISRIVILNTAAFASNRIPLRIAACRWPGLGAVLVRGFNGFAGPATWMTMHSRRLSPEEKRGYLFPYDSWANRVAVHQFVVDIPMEPKHRTRETLLQIERALPRLDDVPKLLVWGGKDFCFNDHFFQRWREVYPRAEAEYLSDIGHYVLDDGGPRVRDRIATYLVTTTP
jgi:cis-3-alkyl-4-acyloxetan-2-one decarboxylase